MPGPTPARDGQERDTLEYRMGMPNEAHCKLEDPKSDAERGVLGNTLGWPLPHSGSCCALIMSS